jgi:hypothetical protein
MSDYEQAKKNNLYVGVAVLLAILVLAAFSGRILGKLSVPKELPPDESGLFGESTEKEKAPQSASSGEHQVTTPLYFFVTHTPDGNWSLSLREVEMAAHAGIHRYVVPVPLAWNTNAVHNDVLPVLQEILDRDPHAEFLLQLDLNPPASWMNTAGETELAESVTLPSPASPRWLQSAQDHLGYLLQALSETPWKHHVSGYILTAMENGHWYCAGDGVDPNEELTGFQRWLSKRYPEDAQLEQAWGAAVSIDAVTIPTRPLHTDAPGKTLLDPKDDLPWFDFLHFRDESTADLILALTSLIKRSGSPAPEVYVPYGFTLEETDPGIGHYSLGRLLESDLDGFISPVSYMSRGLGTTGGLLGTIHSAIYHNKQWLLLDETRTGVEGDPRTGAVSRLKGLRAEDVYNVQRRNFAAAMTYNLGVIWSDPQGKGWLLDKEQWTEFAGMRELYTQAQGDQNVGALSPARLLVVVDEDSRAYQHIGSGLNTELLTAGRDAALKTGVPTTFCLLSDVLNDVSPPAPVYLFLNAFELSDEERSKLHSRLKQEEACAIWLYAPGYFGVAASVENISATTGMNVEMFEGPARSGTRYILDGHWLKQEDRIGESTLRSPLFFIDDEEADALAQYESSEQNSVAMRALEGGWTSVYIAEPTISAGLLREIFSILELHLYIQPSDQKHFDTYHINGDLLAIHGAKVGERAIALGGYYDVVDLFDSEIGWSGEESFLLHLKTGETRLFRLQAVN